jgi:hypothetical protein
MRKLELHSISELVRYAVKNQIIEARSEPARCSLDNFSGAVISTLNLSAPRVYRVSPM